MAIYGEETLYDCCADLEITVGVEGLLYVIDAEMGNCSWIGEEATPPNWECLGFVTGFTFDEATNDIKVPCRFKPAHHWKKGRPERTWSIDQLFTEYPSNIWSYRYKTLDFRLVINKNGVETTPGTPDCDAAIFVYNARITNCSYNIPDTDEVTTAANGEYDSVEFAQKTGGMSIYDVILYYKHEVIDDRCGEGN